MKTMIQTEVMTFDDLNDKAKDEARAWYGETLWEDYEFARQKMQEDAKRIGLELESYDIDSASFIKNVTGNFETSAPEVAESIIKEHGSECSTYRHAEEYLADLKLLGEACDAEDGSPAREAWEASREKLDGALLDVLLHDYGCMLQQELDYRCSNEYIDEAIRANEYTFTADGKRFG